MASKDLGLERLLRFDWVRHLGALPIQIASTKFKALWILLIGGMSPWGANLDKGRYVATTSQGFFSFYLFSSSARSQGSLLCSPHGQKVREQIQSLPWRYNLFESFCSAGQTPIRPPTFWMHSGPGLLYLDPMCEAYSPLVL